MDIEQIKKIFTAYNVILDMLSDRGYKIPLKLKEDMDINIFSKEFQKYSESISMPGITSSLRKLSSSSETCKFPYLILCAIEFLIFYIWLRIMNTTMISSRYK